MTNGEKIKATFPYYDIEIYEHKGYVRIFYENFYTTYPWGWWNSEYQEPTTKNDHHRQNIQAYAHDFGVSEEQAEKELRVTTKNDCETCIHNKGVLECDMYGCKYESTTKNDLGVDAVSREAVQTRLKEIINEMETIFADIREREVNDSVCGLCEYDCDHGLDGFANECPGFEKDDCFKLNEKYKAEWLDISNLPPVTPQEPKCKDCKWWKDSDGKYRRGCGAESQCPINTHTVYCGEGYCYMFSPKVDMRGEEE